MRLPSQLVFVSFLFLLTSTSAWAQQGRPKATSMPVATDSLTKVYTYVQFMPLYRGEEGTKKLAKDLLRGFQAAIATTGCTIPDFPVVVSLTVGPSGAVYDAKSINNMPLISEADSKAGVKGIVGTRPNLQRMSTACEEALIAAARKLPALDPGSLNGRRVAVSYTIRLLPAK